MDTAPRDPGRFEALRGFCDGVPPPDASELANHVECARRRLHDRGLGALVVEPGASMRYFSGVGWGLSERPFLLVIPRAGEPFWVCPAFEVRSARERLGERAELLRWEEHESPYLAVVEGLRARGHAGMPVAVDPAMRQFVVEGIAGAVGKRVTSGASVANACRVRKSPKELACIRRANEATKAALRLCAGMVSEGMGQDDLAALLREAQQVAGLTRPWVLCLFGENAAFPHGTRRERRLRNGDLILVDTGGSLHGYGSDVTRTWPFGQVTEAQRKAWNAVRAAQTAALEHMRPGAACSEPDAAARRAIEKAGYPGGYEVFTHRLGHGIGLRGHEEPYLRPDNSRKLEPGMTMSVEPGIYLPGRFGVRLEEIVAITDEGHEVFGPMAESLERPFG
jgi:Xaa-Pro dipeptidase